ncbi:STAS domain-containing protein [Micromonospora sp. CPCC 206060]|uniref:STAS domain-containing protein n=1 Tax=Micromonospora sp. CPCC 206060 TaxID=3122406 RepID=UPI002FF27003
MNDVTGLIVTPLLRSDRTAQIRLDGELTYDTVDDARVQLHALIDAGCRQLILEVSGITWSDSVGLALLIGLRSAVTACGGEIAVRGATGQLARVLEITGTRDLLGAGQVPGVDGTGSAEASSGAVGETAV